MCMSVAASLVASLEIPAHKSTGRFVCGYLTSARPFYTEVKWYLIAFRSPNTKLIKLNVFISMNVESAVKRQCKDLSTPLSVESLEPQSHFSLYFLKIYVVVFFPPQYDCHPGQCRSCQYSQCWTGDHAADPDGCGPAYSGHQSAHCRRLAAVSQVSGECMSGE